MRFLFWQDGCLYESDGEKTERISMPMYTRAAQMGSAGVIVEEEMTREQCRARFPAPPLGVDLCAAVSPLENRRSGCHCGLHSAYQPVLFTSCNTT
jgi:hypothetical protein